MDKIVRGRPAPSSGVSQQTPIAPPGTVPLSEPIEPRPRRSRITVTGMVRHQVPNMGATECQPIRFTKYVNPHDEDTYERRPKCGIQWQPLDLGPVLPQDVVLVVLGNPSPVPGPRSETLGPVVEVGVEIGGTIIPIMEYGPGETYPVPVRSLHLYRVRMSPGSEAGRYYIYVVPAG